MTYYEGLADSSDPARRVGWLRRVGQAFRFECVRQLIESGDRLVDLGCGDAALARYVADAGNRVEYLGIEQRPCALDGVELPEESRVVAGELFGFEAEDCDVVVGLGCLVDGAGRSEQAMKARATRLLANMRGGRAGVIMAVDLDALPQWRRDRALGGVRAEWFDGSANVLALCREEVALYWGGEIDLKAARAAVARGPWAPWDPAELAWLAERCGAVDEARMWLENDVDDAVLAALVEERLDSLS